MINLLFTNIDIFLLSLSCFFVSFMYLPFTKNSVSFDIKVVTGIYSVLFFLFSIYVNKYFANFVLLNKLELLIILILFLFFVTYLVCLVIHFSLEKIDSRYVGSLMIYGFLSICLGLKMFYLALTVFIILLFLIIVFKLLDSFNLVSVKRTLMIKCDSLNTIDQLKLALGAFNAVILHTKIHRSESYIFSCEYRLNNLAQHIFSKYMFSQKEIREITFYEE